MILSSLQFLESISILKNIPNLLKLKSFFYLALLIVACYLFLCIYLSEILTQCGLDLIFPAGTEEYKYGIFVLVLVAIIAIFGWEFIKFRINRHKILANLSQLGKTQILILIDCYIKSVRFFNYESIKHSEKEIGEFGEFGLRFPDHMVPLIHSNVIIAEQRGGISGYEINKSVWNKLAKILPNRDDFLTHKNLKLDELLPHLNHLVNAYYGCINIGTLNAIGEILPRCEDSEFSERQINKNFINFVENLSKIRTEIDTRCYPNNENTFTTRPDNYTGTDDEKRKIHDFEENIIGKSENCRKVISDMKDHFDCLQRIKKLENKKLWWRVL